MPLSVKQITLGIAVAVFVLMAVGLVYQHSTIASQDATIDSQAKTISTFERDKKAQDKSDKQLKADKEKIAKERDKWKERFNEALRNNPCNDVPFDSDTQQLLNELYGKQGS